LADQLWDVAAPLVASLVGVASACGTTAYGIYMLRVKRMILAASVDVEGRHRPTT
jgi:hypothetical protein